MTNSAALKLRKKIEIVLVEDLYENRKQEQ